MLQVNIEPTFSVYQLVQRTQESTGLLNHRRTMEVISHEIENASIVDQANTVIFSSFQRMSRFLRQEKRYRMLAQRNNQIFVFGVPDVNVPTIPNIHYVPLRPTDQLAKEWFLVSYGQDYYSALATEEQTHIDDADSQRLFKGVWTFDLRLVSTLHQWLSNIVGLRYEEQYMQMPNFNRQVQLMSNTIGRMNVRIMDKRQQKVVLYELTTLIERTLYPALNQARKKPTGDLQESPYRAYQG